MAKSVNSDSYFSQLGCGVAGHGQAVDSHVIYYVHRMRQDEASQLCISVGQRFPSCGLDTQRAEGVSGHPEGIPVVYRSLLGAGCLCSVFLHSHHTGDFLE